MEELSKNLNIEGQKMKKRSGFSVSHSPTTFAHGRHQRRLFELLEEQKEPFMLDVYLLENGCSSSACRRLQSLSSNAFKRRGRLLRCALSKLLKVKTVKMILNWNGKTLIPDCVSEIGIDTHESEFRFLYGSTIGLRGLDRRYRWSCIEMEGTEQLSPVSVLQLHSDEDSSFHSHGKEKDPSTSSLDLLHSPKKASKISETKREMNLLDEKLLDCVEEINSIAQLIGADLFLSKDQTGEIGIEIASVIYKELRDETILEMLI